MSVTYRGVGVMGKWKGAPHEEMPRCGAKTRAGHSCGHFAMKNGRCRYHGGKSTGAKTINGRARVADANLKHGKYTKEAIDERRLLAAFIRDARVLLREI